MRKKAIKKLYTLYTVKGKLENIKKDPEHNIITYSNGKAECIEYHDNLSDWITEISWGEFKSGFGIKILSEDGHSIDAHKYDLCISTYMCNNTDENKIFKTISNIIKYFCDDIYYYEFKNDGLSICKELTGHQYYGSPYESCDECGNCDGARCDYCKLKYIVKDLFSDKEYYNGYDKDKADEIYDKNKVDYSDIIADIFNNYNIDDWFKGEIQDAVKDCRTLFKILNTYEIPYYSYIDINN